MPYDAEAIAGAYVHPESLAGAIETENEERERHERETLLREKTLVMGVVEEPDSHPRDDYFTAMCEEDLYRKPSPFKVEGDSKDPELKSDEKLQAEGTDSGKVKTVEEEEDAKGGPEEENADVNAGEAAAPGKEPPQAKEEETPEVKEEQDVNVQVKDEETASVKQEATPEVKDEEVKEAETGEVKEAATAEVKEEEVKEAATAEVKEAEVKEEEVKEAATAKVNTEEKESEPAEVKEKDGKELTPGHRIAEGVMDFLKHLQAEGLSLEQGIALIGEEEHVPLVTRREQFAAKKQRGPPKRGRPRKAEAEDGEEEEVEEESDEPPAPTQPSG